MTNARRVVDKGLVPLTAVATGLIVLTLAFLLFDAARGGDDRGRHLPSDLRCSLDGQDVYERAAEVDPNCGILPHSC